MTQAGPNAPEEFGQFIENWLLSYEDPKDRQAAAKMLQKHIMRALSPHPSEGEPSD